jgi:hypothetical protein
MLRLLVTLPKLCCEWAHLLATPPPPPGTTPVQTKIQASWKCGIMGYINHMYFVLRTTRLIYANVGSQPVGTLGLQLLLGAYSSHLLRHLRRYLHA